MNVNTIAIMQPYFLPYLGYFQLIASVETFVVLDDVKLTKNSWINRNRLLIAGEARWISVPVKKKEVGSRGTIRDHSYDLSAVFWKKTRETIKQNYSRAVDQKFALQLFAKWEDSGLHNVSTSNWHLISQVMERLEIKPERVFFSSENHLGEGFTGQERIVKICHELECNHYINLPGGRSLYDANYFNQNNLGLSFIEPELFPYRQTRDSFEPALSVLDFLMNIGANSGTLFDAPKYRSNLGIGL